MIELQWIVYTGAFGLIIIGLFGLITSDHLMRLVLSLGLLETGANLLLVITGFRYDAVAPIIVDAVIPAQMVDPIPQALVLTSIVIGVAVQAFAISLVLRLWRQYRTLSMTAIWEQMQQDISESDVLADAIRLDAPRKQPLQREPL